MQKESRRVSVPGSNNLSNPITPTQQMITATRMTPTEALSHFVVFEDQNGESQWKLNDDASMELSKLVMEMHDGELPNNWRFDTIWSIFSALKTDDPIDIHELADSFVDIYNHELKAWVSTHTRDDYIDNAISDGMIDMGSTKLFVDLIRYGQYHCLVDMITTAVLFFGLEVA